MSHLGNSGEEVLSYSLVKDGAENVKHTDPEQLQTVYYIDRCVAWVRKRALNKIAVQFPQELCRDAPPVALLLSDALQPSCDVTIIYNSRAARCCVSQKDADYRNAEGIIQFGRSCLTPVGRVPVFRVLAPNWQLNVQKVVSGICSLPEVQDVQPRHDIRCPSDEELRLPACGPESNEDARDSPKKIVILYDTRCAYAMNEIAASLQQHLSNFEMSKLLFCENSSDVTSEATGDQISCSCPQDYSLGVCSLCFTSAKTSKPVSWLDQTETGSKSMNDSGLTSLNTSIVACDDIEEDRNGAVVLLNGRIFHAPRSRNRSDLLFIYIGKSGPTLTSMTLNWPQCSFNVLDPITGLVAGTNAAKVVMQRNYKIEQIRDADTIGVLISNYNLPGFHALLDRLTSLVIKAGKMPFIQYSADPDLPKLMNVPGVDVYIYIACPESTIVERQVDPELYKMLATPWELEVALNPERSWGLNFETNSTELLEGGRNYIPLPDSGYCGETVSVSLLSNRTQALGVSDVDTEPSPALDAVTGAVQPATERALLRVLEGRDRGLLWGETPWRGLDTAGDGEGASLPLGTVVEGKKGVAGGYTTEGA